ncbi:hypothetical protein D7W81_40935, partial [Corallococcus aberystwythensis]
ASPTATPRPSVPEPVPPKPPSEPLPPDIFDGPVGEAGPMGNAPTATGSSIRLGSAGGGQGIEDKDQFKPPLGSDDGHPRPVPPRPRGETRPRPDLKLPPKTSPSEIPVDRRPLGATGTSVRGGGRGNSEAALGCFNPENAQAPRSPDGFENQD